MDTQQIAVTIPNFPGKHDETSVFTVEDLLDDAFDGDAPEIPSAVIICFQDWFFDRVVETHTSGEPLLNVGDDQMYKVTDEVAVTGNFGIGSAVTAALTEEKAALGADTFCILGNAGCLDPTITPDEAILATRAIRDEGASYHYLPPEDPARPTASLRKRLDTALTDAAIPVTSGPTWTIDAFYRETVPEVEQYASEGVITVEMEAASLFAVAEYLGVDAAAVFAIGDYVTPDTREVPSTGRPLLPDLFEPTVDALCDHVQ